MSLRRQCADHGSNKRGKVSSMRICCRRVTFSVDRRQRTLTPLISPPAQGATGLKGLKVSSKRLDVWSPATVVCW